MYTVPDRQQAHTSLANNIQKYKSYSFYMFYTEQFSCSFNISLQYKVNFRASEKT